jgi:molybdopterin-guanine dinucleotide biosynthesis protein A
VRGAQPRISSALARASRALYTHRVSSAKEAGAIVLVGGQSSRMGQPKAALDFGGIPLLTRIVVELKWWFDEIVIVAAPEWAGQPRIEIPGLKIVHDETAFAGPLDALRRGLNAIEHGVAFACSCDLPLLNSDVAADFVAMLEDFDAVIPEVGGKLQPLHAVYRKKCASAIESLESSGETRLTASAEVINGRKVGEEELRKSDPQLSSFFNVNTPEDYQRALKLAGIAR